MNKNEYVVMIAKDSVRVYQLSDGLKNLALSPEEDQAMSALLTIGNFGSYAGYTVEACSEQMAILEAGIEIGRDRTEAEHE